MSDHDKLLRDMELALIAISEPYSFDKPSATSLSARTTLDTEAEMAEMVAALLSRARETRGELQAARAEVAAVDAAISDRGVSERDCSLPLAKRVDNLILELRECRSELAQTAMENEKLRADLREAMELLRAHGQPPDWMHQHPARCASWERRYGALLAKHKETP